MSPYDAAIEYHYLTEKYDRSICSGKSPIDGITALPANQWETQKITQHAHRRRVELAVRCNLTTFEFDDIIRKTANISFERLERIYSQRIAAIPIMKGAQL